jgi:hypothetical protein
MDLYVIRRSSVWADLAELEAADAKSAKISNEAMPDTSECREMRFLPVVRTAIIGADLLEANATA